MENIEQNNQSLQEATHHQKDDNTLMVSVETRLDGDRLKNFYITNAFQGFVWMIFHFSVIYFFTFLLESIALVGIFLWFANLMAFFLDIPLGIIQRYISTKKLFIIAAIAQLIATGIFFGFIFKVFSLLGAVTGEITPDALKNSTDWFFGSALNWIGVLVASICYGVAKEINDVSTFWYILSRANPSQYATILARNNITFGIGSLLWLLVSGIILSFNAWISIILLALLIVGFLFFMIRYFDNDMDSLSIKDIDNFRVSIQKWSPENVKEYVVQTIKKTDIKDILKGVNYLMIKPKQKMDEKIPWKSVMQNTKTEFQIILGILTHKPLYKNLIWTVSLVLIFWFWDTFASSFLLDFLDQVKNGWSFILLAIIGVPGIVLQEFASNLWEKIGIKTIGIIGLVLSGGSLILMWILAMIGLMSPAIIISVALINSLWYACGMSTWQNQFLDIYNRIYAQRQWLSEIDANASSWPMKVIQNLANVIGLVFWWLLVWLWFPAFFIIFWVIILIVFVYTMIHNNEIHV